MNKKIYLSMRLDRIAPKCDRAYIILAAVLLCAAAVSATVCLILNFTSYATPAIAVNATGYALWAVGEFFIIKETIRNRFFSAVLLLICSIPCLLSLIWGTVIIFN